MGGEKKVLLHLYLLPGWLAIRLLRWQRKRVYHLDAPNHVVFIVYVIATHALLLKSINTSWFFKNSLKIQISDSRLTCWHSRWRLTRWCHKRGQMFKYQGKKRCSRVRVPKSNKAEFIWLMNLVSHLRLAEMDLLCKINIMVLPGEKMFHPPWRWRWLVTALRSNRVSGQWTRRVISTPWDGGARPLPLA